MKLLLKITVVCMLSLYSMGGCDESNHNSSRQQQQEDSSTPVVPVPAAIGLAAIGALSVIVSARRMRGRK